MIGRLRGLLLELSDEETLIEVGGPNGGIGYIVRCGVRTLANMPELGAEVVIHIESVTREDGTRLFGFLTKDERQAFVTLQGVQGVGPKAALAVLDIMTPSELAHAVVNDDKTRVGRASGVGPKLAQRIVIELKGKPLTATGAFEPVGYSPASVVTMVKPSVNGESVTALMGLGMSEQQSRQAVETAVRDLGPEAELAAVIRASLKALGR